MFRCEAVEVAVKLWSRKKVFFWSPICDL